MKKDLRKVLENGKEYRCVRLKNGCIGLIYYENGECNVYDFYDTKHSGYLSNTTYFETPDRMLLQITLINSINFVTGSVSFKGRIHIFD